VVHQEINEMSSLISGDVTGQRKFVPISLDGASLSGYTPLAPFHADVSFQELYARAGAEGALKVSAVDWYGVVKALLDALGVHDVLEVRFVVAAMTRDQATEILNDPDRYAQDPESFRLMLRLMDKTSPFDVGRYQASPNEWIPFPQLEYPLTIREIIEEYDREKRTHAGKDAKWVLVSYSDEMASSDIATRTMARTAIGAGPCLVILDPVSLLHNEIYSRFITTGGLQHHPEAFVLGVAPFVAQMHGDLFETAGKVDDQLYRFLASAYDCFHRHFEPGQRTCVLNLEHEYQFMRWIQVAADRIIAANRTLVRARAVHPTNHLRMLRRLAKVPGSVKQPGPEVIRMGAVEGTPQ
jgi:hypothetical protein